MYTEPDFPYRLQEVAMPFDCFISYASADLAIAERLHRRLREAGFNVWFDRARLQPGYDWHREIEAGCEASRVLLPVLTPRWKRSEWTRYETYGAEAVIPLVVEGRFEDVATPPLLRFQAHTLDVAGDEEAQWPWLLEAVRGLLARPPLDADERRRRTAHLRYRPTAHFVGREPDLERIHEQLHVAPSAALTQGQVQAITALGGVGKTALARMYAEKFWRSYEQIFWVDVRAGYEAEFARVCELLLPDLARTSLKEAKDSEKAQRALRELERLPGPRLLILDDAQDESTAAARIPKTGDVHTLITSRFAHWEAIPARHIYVIEPEPARHLLLERSGRSESAGDEGELAACDQLAKSLGYLPLALEQAAAFMRKQGRSFGFRDYLRLSKGAERELLSRPVQGTTEYPAPVFTTWRTTVERLPAAPRALMRLASFMAPTEIPIGLFEKASDLVRSLSTEFPDVSSPDPTVASASVELEVRQWREILAEYSMVSVTETDGLTVHPLVQAVERLQPDDDGQRRWLTAAIDAVARYAPPDAYRFENWEAWRMLEPHAEVLCQSARSRGMTPVKTELLGGLSLFHMSQGRYEAALPLAREALAQNEERLGPEHPHTLASVNNLAGLLARRGEHGAAEPLFRRAAAAFERVLGPAHPATLTALNDLASLLDSQGDFATAERLYREALARRIQTLGAEHPDTLVTVNNLAGLLEIRGHYDAAERLYRDALAARERIFGRDHPDTLISVNNLALLLKNRGDSDAAEPLYRRALVALERVLGPEHPDTLATVNNLAALLESRGDHDAAEPLYRRALNASERVLGPDHPDTWTCTHNLGCLLRSRGDLDAAEPLFRRALAARERLLGPQHPATLTSMNDLALLLQRRGDDAAAEPLFRRALEVLERVAGWDHPGTLTCVNNLAWLLQSREDYAAAEPLYRRALDGFERGLGPQHPTTVTVRDNWRRCRDARDRRERI